MYFYKSLILVNLLSIQFFCSLLAANQATRDRYETNYQLTTVLPYLEHGWFSPENKKNLEMLIKKLNPKVVVELGSWLGLSTFNIASQMQPGSKLYAVDTWQGSPEHVSKPEFSKFLPTLFDQFLSNRKHKNLEHIVVAVRMKTLEAANFLNVNPALIYVDASHEEEAVFQDIMAWYPKLLIGGVMCGDDYFWPSVVKAVKRAAKELKQKINFDRNFWYFSPKTNSNPLKAPRAKA